MRVVDIDNRLFDRAVVFASDCPHPAGCRDAAARFRQERAGRLDELARTDFFGGGADEALSIAA